MPDQNLITRVVMAKKIASRWIAQHAKPEYRVQVFYKNADSRNFPNLLRSFREGQVKIGNNAAIPDLGVEEQFDSVVLWSKDRKAMLGLVSWLEQEDYETTGLW